MTNPDYREMCAELHAAFNTYAVDMKHHDLLERTRTLLAQPESEGPKPVVDYSRVPEIATEAQIRSAAQYLIKKRNCDGDLIPAIEYAIARWGRPKPPSLKERALHELNDVYNRDKIDDSTYDTIRRALEQL